MGYPDTINEAERQVRQVEAGHSEDGRNALIDYGARIEQLGKAMVISSPENEAEITATVGELKEIVSVLLSAADMILPIVRDATVVLDQLKCSWDELQEVKRASGGN